MLAALIPRVTAIGEDKAPIKKALIKLAGDAGAQIKAAELTVAAQTIGQLKSALDRVQAAAPKVDATADTAIYAQSRLDWMATRESIETDLGKLRAALANTYKGEAIAGEIEKSYTAKVAPLMTTLDETLATKLDAATKAADAAARASLVTEAKAIMASYQAFVASNPLIADLDSNPFVPLSIQQNVSATLSRLSAAIN